jgi:polysaccharide deacetylase family protein (PEP-CTERM system associated)
MKSIFTVDVEDWFHILGLNSAPGLTEWDSLPSHVEADFLKLLDLFDSHNVSVTCFFLGWVAAKYPHLVREAAARGHEIASHGYSHELVYESGPDKFLEDARKSRSLLEDMSGEPVRGYRSAGFSSTEATPWFFEKLREAGYVYDSSVFPASREHGGMKTDDLGPHIVRTASGDIVEFPISIARVLGRPMCFFGGGYLRLFPLFVIERAAGKVTREGRPVIFYIHPREINPRHPRLPMSLRRRFKCYVNLKTVRPKLERILEKFDFTTFGDFMDGNTRLKVDR